MPGGVTGYELARLTKERYPEVRILLTSGYDAEPASAQDPARSELKVLRKPYKQGDLARALREVLEN
jgi:DNA-binding NarL/FixJ family response regulator